jgi:GTPase SAR1 family protein
LSKASFDSLNSWITELKQNSHPELKIFLIGNKNDLTDDRQVSYEDALNFMHKNNLDYFEETSAKEGYNVEEIFKKAVNLLYSGYLRYLETNPSSNYNTNSIYATVNSKNSLHLRADHNKIREGDESDIVDRKKNSGFCSC